MQKIRKQSDILLFSLFVAIVVMGTLALNAYEVRSAPAQDSLIPLDTSFTYQGYLEDGDTPVDTNCNFRFVMYNAATGGSQVGSANNKNLSVNQGVFSTRLDFGNAFATDQRWLEVRVRCPAGSGSFTTLAPRTEITASPLANTMPGIRLDPNTGHIGINNNTLPYTYWLDVNGSIRSKDAIYVTTSSGGIRSVMDSNFYGGVISIQTGTGSTRSEMIVHPDGYGYVGTIGPNGANNVRLTGLNGSPNNGYISADNSSGNTGAALYVDSTNEGVASLRDSSGNERVYASITSGAGYIETEGSNGNDNVRITSSGTGSNNGAVAIYNSSGNERARVSISSSGNGFVGTDGPNGNDNVRLTSLTTNSNHGYVSVQDSSGNSQAGIYVNSSGDGIVFGDTKNFRMANPYDENTEIWYASLEGPEAGAYVRGTAELVNGQAIITLPDHFLAVASETNMTVQVTPLSADSMGLAVTNKSLDGIVVQELFQGTGTYEFDYIVTAVRQGHEDYEVIRNVGRASSDNADTAENTAQDASDPLKQEGAGEGGE